MTHYFQDFWVRAVDQRVACDAVATTVAKDAAMVGVPAIVVSTTLVVGGAGNVAAGIRGLTQSLSTGSGSGTSGSHTTPALPDSYWINKQLPKQVTPGTRRIDIRKPSGRSTGEIYDKTGHYDEHGRLVAITDRTVHGQPALHPNPHHHRFDPKTGTRIKNPETGNFNWPGEYSGP